MYQHPIAGSNLRTVLCWCLTTRAIVTSSPIPLGIVSLANDLSRAEWCARVNSAKRNPYFLAIRGWPGTEMEGLFFNSAPAPWSSRQWWEMFFSPLPVKPKNGDLGYWGVGGGGRRGCLLISSSVWSGDGGIVDCQSGRVAASERRIMLFSRAARMNRLNIWLSKFSWELSSWICMADINVLW